MAGNGGSDHVSTVVIGGSQSGLAVGYHLMRQDRPFVILDASDRVGDSWRERWDSLRLFTTARYDGLPGMAFPAPAGSYPTKDQVAEYLEAYAARFHLPVRTGTRVDTLSHDGDRFEVAAGHRRLSADNVVVATGAYHDPRVPSFADQLDPEIVQLHSSAYRRSSQLQDGGVLIVGAGNSGAELALEAAQHHHTWLSGPDTGQEPTRAGSLPDRILTPLYWFLASRVLTVDSRIGRKVRSDFLDADPPRGIPLGRVRRKDFRAAGIERVARTVGVREGLPVLADGRVLEVRNILWCTGFITRFAWIDLPVIGHDGYPVHERGVVPAQPGLYFVGLPFLHSLSSALLGGVGRDAGHLASHIAARSPVGSAASQSP